jgi:hypothetical protein
MNDSGHGTIRSLTLGLLVLACTSASAQTIVASGRLGNNLEDATYVDSGPWAGKVAILDGFDVIATSPNSRRADVMFSVAGLDVVAPRGIAFASSTGLFYYCIPTHPDRIFVTDSAGVTQPSLTIGFAPGEAGFSCEGMSYVPPAAAQYPDHLIATVPYPDGSLRVLFLRLDGTIDLVISPLPTTGLGNAIVGIQWIGDGKLAASNENGIWTMDYAGQVTAQPFARILDASSLEGLAQLDNGRLVAVDYARGHLFVFNAKGYRLGGEEADFGVGIGLSRPLGIAWDASRGAFLMTTLQAGGDSKYHVTAVNHTLKGFTHVATPPDAATSDSVVLNPFGGVTSIPGENLLAVATRGPASIALFDATSGKFLYRYSVPGLALPGGITYDATNRQFAVRPRTPGPLQLIPRDGTPGPAPDIVTSSVAGTLTLTPAPAGGGISWFKSGGTPRFAAGNAIYDAAGGQVGTAVTPAALGLQSINGVTAITSGPYKGLFAAINVDSSTVVVYSVP